MMQLSHRCQPGRCGSRSQCTPAAAARGQRRSGACIQPRPPGSRLSTRRHRAQLLEPVCSHAEEASEPSTSGVQPLTPELESAWALLKAFNAQAVRGTGRQFVATPEARAKLRDALLLAYAHPNIPENWNPALNSETLLGVLASDARLAVRALRDWCQALDLEFVMPTLREVTGATSLAAVTGGVYVKYNSTSKLCYLSQYSGSERGVLVQMGPGPMFGHFPLGLFDEGMTKPAPTLEQQQQQQQQQQQKEGVKGA